MRICTKAGVDDRDDIAASPAAADDDHDDGDDADDKNAPS